MRLHPPSAARLLRPALAAALALGSPAASAQNAVFAGELEDGSLHLTDRPPSAAYRQVAGEAVVPAAASSGRYDAQVRAAASRHGLDPLLVHAVVRAESGYDPRAVSRKGAAGLMQLMPGTAASLGVADRFVVEANLDGGARYLKALLARFDGDLGLALAAYNAGEGAVLRAGRRVPPYPETRDYVRRVQRFYRAAAGGADPSPFR